MLAERASQAELLEQGVLTGLMGAGMVAAWFLLLDCLQASPFWTPSLLGTVILEGTSPADVTAVSTTLVLAYTGIHMLLFLAAGCAMAWMFGLFENNPQVGFVFLLLFLLFEAAIFSLEVSIMPALVGTLGSWAVGLANLLAAITMFGYLMKRRPRAIPRLREGWVS